MTSAVLNLYVVRLDEIASGFDVIEDCFFFYAANRPCFTSFSGDLIYPVRIHFDGWSEKLVKGHHYDCILLDESIKVNGQIINIPAHWRLIFRKMVNGVQYEMRGARLVQVNNDGDCDND